MAGNKTIFDLPLRTGVTADDRLAIVDSGNTLTSSVKVSDLRDGTGVNTLETLTGDITFSGTNIDISTNGQVIHLSGSTGGGGGGTSFFSADTTNTTNITEINRGTFWTYGTGAINDSFAAGGLNNEFKTSSATLTRPFIIGGSGNRVDSLTTNTTDVGIIGGQSNHMGRQSDNSLVLGGLSNSIGYGYRTTITAGQSNQTEQINNFIGGGNQNSVSNNNSGIVGGFSNHLRATYSFVGGGYDNYINAYGYYGNSQLGGQINYMVNVNNSGQLGGYDCEINTSDEAATIGGNLNVITASADRSAIIGGQNHTLSGHTNSVIIGGSGFTSNHNDEVIVPALTIGNYASLNFADDSAASTGGVPLGGVYHTSGALKVRIT